MLVHLFGATSSPSCCSYALRKTAEDKLADCLKSLATTKEAVQLVGELPKLLARGGSRLTKWVFNEKSVMYHVPTGDRASTVNLDLERPPQERALKVDRNVEEDSFGFRDGTIKRRKGGVSYQMLLHSKTPSPLLHLWHYELKLCFRHFVPERVLKSWKA